MARRRRDASNPISLFAFQDIMAAVTGVMILVTLLLALEPLADELLRSSPRRPESEPVEPPPMSVDAARELVRRLESTLERRLASPAVTDATLAELERETEALRSLRSEIAERRDRAQAALARADARRGEATRAATAAAEAMERALAEWDRAQRRSRVRYLPGERFPKAPLFVEVGGGSCALGELAVDGTAREIARSDRCDFDALAALLGDRSPESHQAVFVVRQDGLAAFDELRNDFHAHGWDVGWQLWDAGEGGFFDPPRAPEVAP